MIKPMQCTNCKSEILDNAKFCPECGNKVENLGKTCPNPDCKRSGLPDEAVFCPDCGTKISTNLNQFSNFTETVNGVSFDMIAIKGGTFQMGSNDGFNSSKPIHTVTMNDFFMGRTAVIQALWQALMRSNPSYFKGDKKPVECVSWYDCQEFITKLNQLIGKKYRLPTEAEWEYAARGGAQSKGYRYAGSNNIKEVAEYNGNNYKETKPVAGRKPNELGLYDMSGNVSEWCSDWYSDYSSTSQTNPTGPTFGEVKVRRGGCWVNPEERCRVYDRVTYPPDSDHEQGGFRLVLP